MDGANIFMIYADSDKKNVTLSPRLGTGEVQPLHENGEDATVTLLSGSGISGGMMTANVKCKLPMALGIIYTHALIDVIPQAQAATAGLAEACHTPPPPAVGSGPTRRAMQLPQTRSPQASNSTTKWAASNLTLRRPQAATLRTHLLQAVQKPQLLPQHRPRVLPRPVAIAVLRAQVVAAQALHPAGREECCP